MTRLFSGTQVFNRLNPRLWACIFLILLSSIMVTPPSGLAAGSTNETGTALDIQKAKLAAEVAAKRPLRLIIRDASASGMSMQEIVTILIKAGVAPAAVVYAAVSEGQKTYDAIKAASSFCCECRKVKTDIPDGEKVKLDTLCEGIKVKSDCFQAIINSAIAAGAGKETVLKAASASGCPSDEIASAISFAETTGAPVYGYRSPAPADWPTSYIPTPHVFIGGGGGGSQPASRYKP